LTRSNAFQKTLSMVFVGLYLLFGGALGHCFVWCVEPGKNAHLEFNLSGNCGDLCSENPVHPSLQIAGDASVSQPCEDVSLSRLLSEVSSSRQNELLPSVQKATDAVEVVRPVDLLCPPRGFFSLHSVSARPPDVAYLTLRTTVLRH